MSKDTYNLIILGGGAAGLAAACTAASYKARVALIEKDKLGGRCLHTGEVPLRAFMKTAQVLKSIKNHKIYGLKEANAHFDFKDVLLRVHGIIQTLKSHDSVEYYQSLGVDIFMGEATVLSNHTVKVNDTILLTQSIVVATGSFPLIPSVAGLDQGDCLHTDNVWKLNDKPNSLIILGGGTVSCEMAQAFASMGTRVTMVHSGKQLLPEEDADMVHILMQSFQEEGIAVNLECQVVSVQIQKGLKSLKLKTPKGEETITADHILCAVGRNPRTLGYGLEHLGLNMAKNGFIHTDGYGQTNIPSIYACGECAYDNQPVHIAVHQAFYCAFNALFRPFKKKKIDWQALPRVVFTDPEIATAGLNERESQFKNIKYKKVIFELNTLNRVITDNQSSGSVKVLTHPRSDAILGVTIVGAHAGEMLSEFVLAMKYKIGLGKILKTMHPHLTYSEANVCVAGVWQKNRHTFFSSMLLKWFHKFRRK